MGAYREDIIIILKISIRGSKIPTFFLGRCPKNFPPAVREYYYNSQQLVDIAIILGHGRGENKVGQHHKTTFALQFC